MLVTSCGIKVKRYVHKDGGLVEIEELTPEERARAATEIALTYLNTLYRGKAVFERMEEDPNEERIRSGA